MTRPESKTDLDAFRWALLEEKGPLSAEQQQEFNTWFTASPRHRGAYTRARAMLLHLERLAALAGGHYRTTIPAPLFVTRRLALVAGLSAVGLFATGSLLVRDSIAQAWHATRYVTDIGQLHTVRLLDGSSMILNTATEACVKYRRTQSEVRLARGEALFQVAHGPRPFVVRVGGLTVRAIGAAFAVRREILRGESMVTVTEGTVQILPPVSATEISVPRPLAANQEAILTEDSIVEVRAVPPAEVERRLAWRKGILIFDGQPLEAAIKELNRYNRREIVVTDDQLAVRPVFGVFRAADTQTFISSVELSSGVRAVTATGGKVLLLPAQVNAF